MRCYWACLYCHCAVVNLRVSKVLSRLLVVDKGQSFGLAALKFTLALLPSRSLDWLRQAQDLLFDWTCILLDLEVNQSQRLRSGCELDHSGSRREIRFESQPSIELLESHVFTEVNRGVCGNLHGIVFLS